MDSKLSLPKFFAEFHGKSLSTVDTVEKKVGIRVELQSLVFIAFSFIDCKSVTIFDLSNLYISSVYV